jgi:hypothetical protein
MYMAGECVGFKLACGERSFPFFHFPTPFTVDGGESRSGSVVIGMAFTHHTPLRISEGYHATKYIYLASRVINIHMLMRKPATRLWTSTLRYDSSLDA